MSDSVSTGRLRVGMSLSAHYEIGADPRAGLRDTMEQVALAEEVGLDSILIGHHYLTRSQFLQPLSVAAYLAARTERIRLGFGVYLLPLTNPVALAEELATLDVLSGGRLIAGFGSGYRSVEYRAMGVPYDERFRRLEEYVTVVRALWSGDPVTMSGSFGELEDARTFLRPVQPGGPPVWVGAFGPVGMRRVARLDAAWAVAPNGDLDEVAARMASFRETLADQGRSLVRDYPLLREGCVAETRQAAADAARPFLAAQYEGYRGWDHGASIDDLLAGQAVVGDPEAVVERLTRYAEIGYTDVVLRLQWTGMPQEDVLRSIRLLGQEVIPALEHVRVGVQA
ncbi:LLM class flavin-dependent oxidoreductase [Arthrobacter sp. I2-34]|uniref:LLM class flavin-dependent oxidoreductase n=1 Tax=Arthrobacter hankyongi TaxID=2904801 RepID=A0ABS9LA53_9MICC|nr:LLM class flavin-dependent oxidoreductase [Arthrobacter hankyongi]MCG2623388.1 LLM class flavin-dependent oxidoreductase [Arthrobacter hankyongi]